MFKRIAVLGGESRGLVLLVALLCAGNIALLVQNQALQRRLRPGGTRQLAIDDHVAVIRGSTLAGEQLTVGLGEVGEVALLYFFSPRCRYCEELAPELATVNGEARDKRVRRLAIVADGSPSDEVADHAVEAGFRADEVLIISPNTAQELGLWGTPLTFVVMEGVVRFAEPGLWSAEAPGEIEALLESGREVE